MNPIPSIITKLSTMADGGVRIQIDTQEIAPEYIAYLFSLKGKYGGFTFEEDEETD